MTTGNLDPHKLPTTDTKSLDVTALHREYLSSRCCAFRMVLQLKQSPKVPEPFQSHDCLKVCGCLCNLDSDTKKLVEVLIVYFLNFYTSDSLTNSRQQPEANLNLTPSDKYHISLLKCCSHFSWQFFCTRLYPNTLTKLHWEILKSGQPERPRIPGI